MSELTGISVIFIMGVSGSGKSRIGQLLAAELDVPFIDADDHHPADNIEKMSNGIPLNDVDRLPWLRVVNRLALENSHQGCVIACSALKSSYRTLLAKGIKPTAAWVYLKGSFDQILDRMNSRKNHFMKAEMLQSQFDILEEPKNPMIIDISASPESILAQIKQYLSSYYS